MKKIYRIFAAGLSCGILCVLTTAFYFAQTLPDHFYVAQGESLALSTPLPIEESPSQLEGTTQVYARAGTGYTTNLKLFGAVEIKEVDVQVVERELVVPSGAPFGIKMFTEGVVVVGLSDVDTGNGLINPAKEAGLKVGDIILEVDGQEVQFNEDISRIISQGNGEAAQVTAKRDDETFTVTVHPVKSATDGGYKAGIWVRDSSAGIGTMTYYDPQTMVFAGLGHAICDIDTGDIMPLSRGEIVDVCVTGVGKGYSGSPGEIKGTFQNDQQLGYLLVNNETGVFGRLTQNNLTGFAIPMALRQEVKTGPAQIYTTISGHKPQKYDIVIEKVNINDQSPTKNMIIQITDPELLEKTGGILQGMSGSPIIQDGKLVGAVTHVFVNDLCRGYGIFAENMQKTAKSVAIS